MHQIENGLSIIIIILYSDLHKQQWGGWFFRGLVFETGSRISVNGFFVDFFFFLVDRSVRQYILCPFPRFRMATIIYHLDTGCTMYTKQYNMHFRMFVPSGYECV